MIAERSEEFAAGELVRELITAIRRRDLFQDVITAQGDVQPGRMGSLMRKFWDFGANPGSLAFFIQGSRTSVHSS